MSPTKSTQQLIKNRFRGFLPVVIDIETAGLEPQKHALLEISAVLLEMSEAGEFRTHETISEHIIPFEGALLDPASLAFNQIDPFQPLRFAVSEHEALERIFMPIQLALKKTHCQRAVLVGHNAWFDLLFLNAAIKRTGIKSPFHAFTCFDTATLSGFIYGQTVLAKAAKAAGISFNLNEAHSAIYDAEKTAALFCKMLNESRFNPK
jgi:ribonuclease T